MKLKDYIDFTDWVWFLKIKVTPKSIKNEFFDIIKEWEDITLKIRVRWVPEKWKVNTELIWYIAKELKEFWVRKSWIEIYFWKSDRVKMLRIKKIN